MTEVRWTREDLLGIAELSPGEIELILDTAESFREVGERPIKKVPALRGKNISAMDLEMRAMHSAFAEGCAAGAPLDARALA